MTQPPLRFFKISFPDPGDNLAFDEALLEALDSADPSHAPGTLRIWHPPERMAVLGRASKIDLEVDVHACQRNGITIQRRCSGGATIVTGPGCLMYALVLPVQQYPEVAQIDAAHQLVLGRLREALVQIGVESKLSGTSDLVIADKKFSGNSLRCKRNAILYHGTLLLQFPLTLISDVLPHPPREPDYRQGRSHDQFVTNLPQLDEVELIESIRIAWNAIPADLPSLPQLDALKQKYGSNRWINTGRR